MKIEELTAMVVDFRERRDWAQYHHPKELASALSIEVSEIMELFRFKSADEVKEMVKEPEFREKVGAELADSLFLLLLLAHEWGRSFASVPGEAGHFGTTVPRRPGPWSQRQMDRLSGE